MSYTLCVVDVQPKFPVFPETDYIQNLRRELALAVERQANIVFLEYDGFGETLPPLKETVNQNRYQRIYYGVKNERDGSVFVRKAVQDRAFYSEQFRVVGAYTDQCVLATVEGIRSWFPRSHIEVVADACRAMSANYHYEGLARFKKLSNVAVINEV